MRKINKIMVNLLTSNTFLFWFFVVYFLMTLFILLGYRVKNQDLRAEVAKQEQQIKDIKNTNNQDKIKLDNKEKEIKELQSEKDILNKKYEQTKLILDLQKKKVSGSENQIVEAQKKISELNSKVEKYRNDLIALNERLTQIMK